MRDEWRKCRSGTMGGHKCIELKHNQEMPGNGKYHERCLSGKYGEIWENNEKSYKCIIDYLPAQKKAISLLKSDKKITKRGEELLLQFDKQYLDEMVKILKIPSSSGRQIRYANCR